MKVRPTKVRSISYHSSAGVMEDGPDLSVRDSDSECF